MKKERRGLVLSMGTILLFFAGTAGRANASFPDQEKPESRTLAQDKVTDQEDHKVDVRLVLVDVIATKDGDFFPGLKKSDFRIFEDGKEVPINSCDIISFGKSDIKFAKEEPGKKDAPPIIVRKKRLAVLFDGLNAWDRDYKKGVQQVADELAALAKQDTEVMIILMNEANGLRMIQPFTDQEDLIRQATEKASANSFSPFLEFKDYDELLLFGRYMKEDDKYLSPGGSLGGEPIQNERMARNTGNLKDYSTFSIGFRGFEYTNKASNKLTRAIGGLLATIHMLESLPGRKNLLLVSGGFPDVDSFKVDNEMPLSRGLQVFDPFGILGKELFWTGYDLLKEIIRVANDRNISIYSLDPSTASKFVYAGPMAEHYDREAGDSQKILFNEKYRQLQNLQMVSDKTGAKLLRGSDKIEGLRQIAANDLSYYYQLSYYPPRKTADKEYHKIEIKLRGRKGAQVKTREGYSDSFVEQSFRVRLAQAFHNPDLFRGKVPFEASFIPFASEPGKTQPWMSLALPVRAFFDSRKAAGKKTYEFHFWIRGDDETGRILTGQVVVPFDFNEDFSKRLSSLDFLRLNYIGPRMDLTGSGSRIIFALFDPETGEIGTWTADCPPPIERGASEPCFVNCVPGDAVSSPTDRQDVFLLDGTDGSLACGQLKFFPKIAGGFPNTEDVHLFVQVYNPQGAPGEARFELSDQSGRTQGIKGTMAAAFWNPRSKILSAVYKIDTGDAVSGDYKLRISLPPATGNGTALVREVNLSMGTAQDK